MNKDNLTIGLFGTCGGSKWRDKFIKTYQRKNIDFYNPQVPDGTWTPECATIEAEHLANDRIILFPITNETYAFGSLSEIGFSILNAIKLDSRRYFLVFIANDLIPELDDEKSRKQSLNARALVLQHLKKLQLNNIYLVDSLDQMLEASIKIHKIQSLLSPLEELNPHKR